MGELPSPCLPHPLQLLTGQGLGCKMGPDARIRAGQCLSARWSAPLSEHWVLSSHLRPTATQGSGWALKRGHLSSHPGFIIGCGTLGK